jgi:hypothetical protein
MTKQHKEELRKYVNYVGEGFSNRKEYNTKFKATLIEITSESTANIVYTRFPDSKQCAMFFYRVRSDYKAWRYFVPTDSHILGMEAFKQRYMETELFNFNKD